MYQQCLYRAESQCQHHVIMMDGSNAADDVTKKSFTSSNGIDQQRMLEVADIHRDNVNRKPPNYDVAITYDSTPDPHISLPNQCVNKQENKNQNNSNAGKLLPL